MTAKTLRFNRKFLACVVALTVFAFAIGASKAQLPGTYIGVHYFGGKVVDANGTPSPPPPVITSPTTATVSGRAGRVGAWVVVSTAIATFILCPFRTVGMALSMAGRGLWR